MWFILAFFSAITVAVRRTRDKQLIQNWGNFTVGWLSQVSSLPFIGIAAVISKQLINPLELGVRFWIPVAIGSFIFYSLNTYLYLQAVKHGELSKVLPIQCLGPLMTMIIARVIFSEQPSLVATTAVVIIVVGIYVLHLKGRTLHNPLLPFMEEKHSLYMLLSVCCTTSIVFIDKIAITASNPVFYSLVDTMGGSLTLYMLARIAKEPRVHISRKKLLAISQVGLLQGATSTSYMMALAIGPAAYVAAIRGSNILMSSLLGIIYFKEQLSRPKIAAFMLITVGSIILATLR